MRYNNQSTTTIFFVRQKQDISLLSGARRLWPNSTVALNCHLMKNVPLFFEKNEFFWSVTDPAKGDAAFCGDGSGMLCFSSSLNGVGASVAGITDESTEICISLKSALGFNVMTGHWSAAYSWWPSFYNWDIHAVWFLASEYKACSCGNGIGWLLVLCRKWACADFILAGNTWTQTEHSVLSDGLPLPPCGGGMYLKQPIGNSSHAFSM